MLRVSERVVLLFFFRYTSNKDCVQQYRALQMPVVKQTAYSHVTGKRLMVGSGVAMETLE